MQWGKRPTVMVMGDEWFGHYNLVTGRPNGDRNEWIDWDFALMKAFEIIEAYTDQDGIPEWKKRDPAEKIDAERKINSFHAAKDRITSAKKYTAAPGEYFIPVLESKRTDGELWTYSEWRDAEREKALEAIKDAKLD